MEYAAFLGVTVDASAAEIKSAYRKKALLLHPDKPGGNATQFNKLTEAYEKLQEFQNPTEQPQAMHNPMEQMFNQFFATQHPGMGNFVHQNPPKVHQVKINLATAMRGMTIPFAYKKIVSCDCLKQLCPGCSGSGIQITHRALGPNMMHRIESVCPACKGHKTVADNSCCHCRGKGLKELDESISLVIPAGISANAQFRFPKLGDIVNGVAADLVVIVLTAEHGTFRVQGHNLAMKQRITLQQALCGFSATITLPNDAVVSYRVDVITAPGTKKVIVGKGFTAQGSLLIDYEIEWPKEITAEFMTALDAAFKTANNAHQK